METRRVRSLDAATLRPNVFLFPFLKHYLDYQGQGLPFDTTFRAQALELLRKFREQVPANEIPTEQKPAQT